MIETGKKVKGESSKGRGSAPAGGYPKAKSSFSLLAIVMIFMLSMSLPVYGDTDYAGADFTPANGSTLTGKYINVGTFTIPAGITVNVEAGTLLEIHAVTINIAGTLNGDLKGYAGGAGGTFGNLTYKGGGGGSGGLHGGGKGNNGSSSSDAWPGDGGGGGGGGSYGGFGRTGYNGGGAGGSAGPGGGSAGPIYGTRNGYDIDMGSGGGGGGGGGWSNNTSGGTGWVGKPGGGGILLKAAGNLSVSGSITANGDSGVSGGSSSYANVRGGFGGGSSGGGILLDAPTVVVSGSLTANGGTDGGGGRIKIFTPNVNNINLANSNISVNGYNLGTIYPALFSITASSGTNGSILPTGAIKVLQGASQTYTITPATGFLVADVLVDGVSVGAVSSYTFSNVSENHTISATFTYQLPTINSVSCSASLYTGQAGACTVSASAAAGTLKYAWTVPGGSAETPTDASTSVTFTGGTGTKLVSVIVSIIEDPSRTITANAPVEVTPVNMSLTVNCPAATYRNTQTACTAVGSSNWGEIAFLWNTDAGGSIAGANNTAAANALFGTVGNHSARVKMYIKEAPFLFIEKVANIAVVFPPPIVYNVGCTEEEVYMGQQVNCSISAGSSEGTLKLLWNAVGGQISDPEGTQTGIIFNTPGEKTVTVKAFAKELPLIVANRQMQVNVLDNPITAEVTCPDQILSKESFTCTVQGNTPLWGTLAFDWLVGSSAVAKGGSANITANREGTMAVRLVASLIESPAIKKEVTKSVKVVGEKTMAPVIIGARTVYIDAENTYKAEAACLTSAKCTVKWRHNEKETAGDTLNITFAAPGKYELEAETTLAGTELTRKATFAVNAVELPGIPVSISGQKAVWVGEEYTYTAVIPLKFSGLNILTRWTLPDNSTVDGRQIKMTPTAEGTNTLQCEGWVDGHREETLKTSAIKITAVGYIFPAPKIDVKRTEGLGPYNVTLNIDYTVKKIMGLQYHITYNWNFGDGETLTTDNTIVHHLFAKIGTYNVTMTATDQYDNTTMDNVTITVGASPVKIGFKVSASNKYMRAPLDIYIRSAIAGKTALDRIESHVWKIDGIAVENTKSEYMRASFSEPGDHTVTFTATMKSGATATDFIDITVVPNQPPTCTIDHISGEGYYVYLKAKCTDPDGRISSYKWNLDDGRDYRNGSGNISFKAPATRTYNIGLKATDDSGAEAEFTKEITVTR